MPNWLYDLWYTGWWIDDPFWRGVLRGWIRASLFALPILTGFLIGHHFGGWLR